MKETSLQKELQSKTDDELIVLVEEMKKEKIEENSPLRDICNRNFDGGFLILHINQLMWPLMCEITYRFENYENRSE